MPEIRSETVLRCSADSFYDHLKRNMNNVQENLPETFRSIQVVEGNGMNMGTVRHWIYSAGGNLLNLKDKVEHIDDENMSITFKIIEGDILNLYDSFRFHVHVIPQAEDKCLVQWTVEYVKKREQVPTPTAYLALASMITREMGHQLDY